MRKDSRLSRILHVLVHLKHFDRPATSEEMGKMMQTNPVVVRRTMALLKEVGYVSSIKGHNGGWSLAQDLSAITLYDIYRLLGEGSLFTLGLSDEHTQCKIEQAVNHALDDVMSEAQTLMLERFKSITIDSLSHNN